MYRHLATQIGQGHAQAKTAATDARHGPYFLQGQQKTVHSLVIHPDALGNLRRGQGGALTIKRLQDNEGAYHRLDLLGRHC